MSDVQAIICDVCGKVIEQKTQTTSEKKIRFTQFDANNTIKIPLSDNIQNIAIIGFKDAPNDFRELNAVSRLDLCVLST